MRSEGGKRTNDLIRIATGADPLLVCALASRYTVGIDHRPSPCLTSKQGDPTAVFNALRETQTPTALVEIVREGFRKTGEALCPFVALLWLLRQHQTATVQDDDFPAEAIIRGVPGWAYDLYSREDRAALANFIKGRTETARWVRDHIPPRQRVGFLGGIVFRVEGGCVRRGCGGRWKMSCGGWLISSATVRGPDPSEILQLMRADIPRGHIGGLDRRIAGVVAHEGVSVAFSVALRNFRSLGRC